MNIKKRTAAVLAAALMSSAVVPSVSASETESNQSFLSVAESEITVAEEKTAVVDTDNVTAYDFKSNNKRIAVYDIAYTIYKLSNEFKLFVNGYEMYDGINSVEEYFYRTYLPVTLKETTGDNYYDEMYIDYPLTAMVSFVKVRGSLTRVKLKNVTDGLGNRLEVGDDRNNLSITLYGKSISPTELEEDDVLSIKFDMNGRFLDAEHYDIEVSRETVRTLITGKNHEENIVYDSSGKSYKLARGSVDDYELDTEYMLYLDTGGRVAHYEECEIDKMYGIIASVFRKAGAVNYTARIIDSTGEIYDYEMSDDSQWMTANHLGYSISDLYSITLDGIMSDYYSIDLSKLEQRAISYKIVDDELEITQFLNAVSGTDGYLAFKASASKLGNAVISDDVTKIVDIRGYVLDGEESAETIHTYDFKDEAMYSALNFDRNDDGVARFVVVAGGIGNVSGSTPLAVVTSRPIAIKADNYDCVKLNVIRNGIEETVVIPESIHSFSVGIGSVIAYEKVNDRVKECRVVLGSRGLSYDSISNCVYNGGDLGSNIYLSSEPFNNWYTKLKFGIITKTGNNTFKLLTSLNSDGWGDLDNAEIIVTDNRTSFTYCDFNFPYAHKMMCSSRDKLSKLANARWNMFRQDSEVNFQEVVSWGLGCSFALVKEVDGIAKEVIVYTK